MKPIPRLYARLSRWWPLVILWAVAVRVIVYPQVYLFQPPFLLAAPRYHLTQLLNHEKPQLLSHFGEESFDHWLGVWNLTAPVEVAMPPMFNEGSWDNPSFLTSFDNHGEAIFYNGPYPHPKFEIVERFTGAQKPGVEPYRFDNRRSNGALSVNLGGFVWPYSFTGWYDMVLNAQEQNLDTPLVSDSDGKPIAPSAVRAVSPLNTAKLKGPKTLVTINHLSPFVWTFPGQAHLNPNQPDFAVEQVPDGLEVSWIARRPQYWDALLGMMLLTPAIDHTHDALAPSWWPLDERFRHAVVDGRPPAEKRALLEQLAEGFPTHPMLKHYRVIAELGGDGLDAAFLARQEKECDIASWNLIVWTHIPWRRARTLPCTKNTQLEPFYSWRAELAQWLVMAYRDERDDPFLHHLAERVANAGFFPRGARKFNYAPNDFSWLWLQEPR